MAAPAFIDGGVGVDTFVWGPAALLSAKAYKVHDRMDAQELRRNADRLRAKDFADMYRPLLAAPAVEVAAVFARGSSTERIGAATALGRVYLTDLLETADFLASQVADAWQDPDREPEFIETITVWRTAFLAATPTAAGE